MKDSPDKARQFALKLLSYRGRSEKELAERLHKKGFTKPVIFSTIHNLKDVGLIDDLALAGNLKEVALATKMLSQNGAKRYLLNKGISQEICDSVFSLDKTIDSENAKLFADKKRRVLANYPPETVRRRLYNLLLRRGYSHETIMPILKNINAKEEDET